MTLLLTSACLSLDFDGPPDEDGDGYFACYLTDEAGTTYTTCTQPDCDDTDPTVSPGAASSCERGLDHDCDGTADYLATGADCDRDGVVRDSTQDAVSFDCNDLNSLVSPLVAEDCDDELDNDCDGLTDADDLDCTEGE